MWRRNIWFFLAIFLCMAGIYYVTGDLSKSPSMHRRMEAIASKRSKARQLFTKVKDLSAKIVKPSSYASRPECITKNRHQAFLPYDENRSCREIEDFYISASDVVTPLQSYVVAQAPLENTVTDFWKMVLYKKSALIITACMPVESGSDKCFPYWEAQFLPSKVLGFRICLDNELVLQEGSFSQRIVKREFIAYNEKNNEKRTITQLHFENWPDFGTPDPELFQIYLYHVDTCLKNSESPIVVHCSAGIGRSGVFVAVHSLRKELLAQPRDLSVSQRVYDLRKQRAHMVTTSKQFQFIYKALLSSTSNAIEKNTVYFNHT